MPWRQRIDPAKSAEDVRPVYWANRPRSYMARTLGWAQYPNGRWGDTPRIPEYAALSKYHLDELHTVDPEARKAAYGTELKSVADVSDIFAKFVTNEVKRLPWCCALEEEGKVMVRLTSPDPEQPAVYWSLHTARGRAVLAAEMFEAFVHRCGRDLTNMAKKRPNVVPIVEDARMPARYRMFHFFRVLY